MNHNYRCDLRKKGFGGQFGNVISLRSERRCEVLRTSLWDSSWNRWSSGMNLYSETLVKKTGKWGDFGGGALVRAMRVGRL